MIDRLRRRAKELGKTQRDIAAEIGVSPISISHMFRGRFIIQSCHISPLARALRMHPAEVLEIVEWVLAHTSPGPKGVRRPEEASAVATVASENTP